jgi:hypothetical protein
MIIPASCESGGTCAGDCYGLEALISSSLQNHHMEQTGSIPAGVYVPPHRRGQAAQVIRLNTQAQRPTPLRRLRIASNSIATINAYLNGTANDNSLTTPQTQISGQSESPKYNSTPLPSTPEEKSTSSPARECATSQVVPSPPRQTTSLSPATDQYDWHNYSTQYKFRNPESASEVSYDRDFNNAPSDSSQDGESDSSTPSFDEYEDGFNRRRRGKKKKKARHPSYLRRLDAPYRQITKQSLWSRHEPDGVAEDRGEHKANARESTSDKHDHSRSQMIDSTKYSEQIATLRRLLKEPEILIYNRTPEVKRVINLLARIDNQSLATETYTPATNTQGSTHYEQFKMFAMDLSTSLAMSPRRNKSNNLTEKISDLCETFQGSYLECRANIRWDAFGADDQRC